MILKISLHDMLGFSNIIVLSQSSLLSSWIIRKCSGRGIVRENKSRALSIARHGAANQRGWSTREVGREGRGEVRHEERDERSSDKKIEHYVEFFSSYRDWYEHGRATVRVIPAGF